MSQPVRPVIAIIGGGASGTLVAWNLWRRRTDARIVILDPSPIPAVGLAYATPSDRHFLNVPAGNMSAAVDDPGHFLRWLRETRDPSIASGQFMPRGVFGRYLTGLWMQAQPEWRQVRVLSCRRSRDGQLGLALSDGTVLHAGYAVLATGNFGPASVGTVEACENDASIARYHPSGWDNAFYDLIAPDDAVVLIGTGLTALDVLIRLRETGYRGHVVAVSRNGWRPERHAACEKLAEPVIANGVTPSARAYFRAFREALASGVSWRSAVDSLRPQLNHLWQSLPVEERKRFRRHLQRRWDIVRHRIAPEVADFMDNELACGALECRRGRVSRVVSNAEGIIVEGSSPAGPFCLQADHVVNCTGPSRAYREMGDILPHVLLEEGMAQETALGGLLCREDGALVAADGMCFGDIFAIGPMRWGTVFETTAIPEIRQQAADIAALLEHRIDAKS